MPLLKPIIGSSINLDGKVRQTHHELFMFRGTDFLQSLDGESRRSRFESQTVEISSTVSQDVEHPPYPTMDF